MFGPTLDESQRTDLQLLLTKLHLPWPSNLARHSCISRTPCTYSIILEVYLWGIIANKEFDNAHLTKTKDNAYLHQSYLKGQIPSPHWLKNPPSVLQESSIAKFRLTSARHWSWHLQLFFVVVSGSAFELSVAPKHLFANSFELIGGVCVPEGQATKT